MIENRLAVIMAEQQLTINDVVQKTGLSRNSISHYVNDRRANISMKTFEILLKTLDITPNQFFKSYEGYNSFEQSSKSDRKKLEQIRKIIE